MITLKRDSKKCIYNLLFAFIMFFSFVASAQDSLYISKQIPVTKLFYQFDKNLIGSFKYNYGLNYLVAGIATYSLIEGDADWNWYRYTYKNKWIYNTGYASVYTGWVVPFAVPLSLYLYGRSERNTELQITGLALGQAALIAETTAATFKTLTGRKPPTKLKYTDDFRGDFRFGFLKGGVDNGWPSSHTTIAFAMATTLAELYPDNTVIKIGAFTYASLIGFGVSTNIHWFSDVVAGALIGYAVGKSVGISFRNLKNNTSKTQTYNFYITPSGAAFNYWF
ncbi:MAG: phosphatase PAP2 family protein [Bacteroidia bacterium]|nr:phosphatase PAP2 family protein [Bacteroidia bacterium]